MTDLVTLQDAYDHLRLDYDSSGSDDDVWLQIFIPAISDAVRRWVKVDARLYVPELDSEGEPVVDSDGDPVPELDSDGEMTVLPIVRAAVLVELSSQYRFREGEGKDNIVPADAGYGYVLNKASTALLTSLRKPTVA